MHQCPKCKASDFRWTTVNRDSIPIDIWGCGACGTPLAEEDWMCPLRPMMGGACINCGARREGQQCGQCGLTEQEDAQVHDELRQMVSPQHSMFEAAQLANQAGRRLMALKLATAAAHQSTGDQSAQARALRIWLLTAIGELNAAIEDGRLWVEATPDAPTIAWAAYGQQLERGNFTGAAADAYAKALKKSPREFMLRARRSALLLGMNREGQAIDEACTVLEYCDQPEPLKVALEVAEQLCDLFESQYRNDEIDRMLERAEDHVEKSPKLLGHRARLAAVNGDTSGAKRDLKRARKLNPELEIYERVERAIKPARSSWWRW